MKVTVLGGSAAGPNPGAGCSGLLVSNAGLRLVLDLGPGTLAELFKHVRPDEISAIVLSHMHQDHWLDLIPLRYRLKYAPGSGGIKIPVHLPPGGKNFLSAVAHVFADDGEEAGFFSDVFILNEYDPAAGLEFGCVDVRFARSVHPLACWMLRVGHPSGDLGYTADTGLNPGAASFLQDVRCLVVEATWIVRGAPGSHLTAAEAGQLAADCRAGETVLTHLWMENDPNAILSGAASAYSGQLHLAAPGLTVEWE